MRTENGKNQAALPERLRIDYRMLASWPWLLVAVAWALALLATWTNQRYLINHDYLLEESGLPWLVAFLLFLICWQVMTAAMMLPSSLPQVFRLVGASRPAQHPHRVLAAFLAGYAAIWTAFAVAAFVGDTGIHQLVYQWPWLSRHTWVIGTATFVLAGIFQCTPFKQRALSACRHPAGSFGRASCPDGGSGWRLGLRYGQWCTASCWALMLVMFGIGVGSVTWMAALAGIILVEKAVPGGRWLSPVVGLVLFLLAALWASDSTWLLYLLGG
jgi:predicted metal-binding membrane protein